MSKRFAIAIVSAVAAAGVMALGAQTAAAATYDTTISLTHERPGWPSPDVTYHHGWVKSEVRRCMVGRHVAVFKRRSGADRKLGGDLSVIDERYGYGVWGVEIARRHRGGDLYARVRPKVRRHHIVCRADVAGYRAAAR